MVGIKKNLARWVRVTAMTAGAWLAGLPLAGVALAAPGTVNVTVKAPNATAPIDVGFRWLLEEDSTYAVTPGDATTTDTLALSMHKSHMTVVAQGRSSGNGVAAVTVPDTQGRYFLSILPDHDANGGRYTMSGRQITPEVFAPTPGSCPQGGCLTVTVPTQPTPTAQIFARAFQDSAPINGTWDDAEAPLEGFAVFIYDMGGQLNTDTFGNPLGTVYDEGRVDAEGNPVVLRLGDGTLHTMTAAEVNDPARNPYGLAVGEVLVKNIAPGKYGMQMVPPAGKGWVQTSTIEGTPGLDNWVKANEPRYFAEFGPAGHHSEYGFVNPSATLNDFPKPGQPGYVFNGTHTISGRIVNMHMSRAPDYSFHAGHPLTGAWVGLNDATGTRGLIAKAADSGSGEFSIPNVAPGTYQLVVWDRYLDNIIAFQSVTVGGTTPDPLVDAASPADVPVFRWFGAHEHWVFNDTNGNGLRDADEAGIPDQTINLRYRDGSIYASSTTDTTGYLPFDEIFPFFSWLVAEVDFARYKATGVTVAVDTGGPVKGELVDGSVPSNERPGNIGHGHLNPQIQDPADGGSNCDVGGVAGCQTRTEQAQWDAANPDGIVAPPLLEGYNGFLGTTDVFEWGKQAYGPGENGGITGVVYYTTTRAENDPRFAAAETWEPGIPRVALALYYADANGVAYHKVDNGDGTFSRGAATSATDPLLLADVDNYPLGWQDGGTMGPEDVDRDGDGVFQLHDALEAAHTDSWDDNIPTNCPDNQSPGFFPDPFYQGGKCYDGLRNYSQVRPAVFDGGYAFGKPFTPLVLQPGYYVVQAIPPRGFLGVGAPGADANGYGDVYEIQQEEDKNVDFGDTMAVSPQALPPLCVGGPNTGTAPHFVPDELALFPGVPTDSRYTGNRPGCDFRQVFVADGKNTAADFFMFTETPITGHIQGFVLNDLANEFDPRSPNFGEKMAPSWIPVSVRDYMGNEVYHTYTDRWGTYNAIVPSAYRINTPMPSGVSPNMLQVCLNAPTMQDALGEWRPEPFHNRQYTQFCYTLDFKPGQTTYLDTPVLPIAAFVGPNNWQLDCDYLSGTPVINFATVGSAGPYISAGGSRSLVIHSLGNVQVPDPRAPRVDSPNPNSPNNNLTMVTRDFGFGTAAGQVWIGNQQVPAANVSWSNDQLTVNVPATIGGQAVRSGQLKIVRSNGLETVHGLTLTIDQQGQAPTNVRNVSAGQSIQAAIDAANAGDMVMVAPGTYAEMLVITKPIRLQGWGASSVIINPVQSPTEKISQWRAKLNALANCTQQIGLLPGQPNNTPSATAPCGYTPGSGLFLNEEGAGILVAPRQGVFGRAIARIDGLQVTGADQAAGILVNAYAAGLEISNNILANNQGPYAAGIRVGQPLLLDANDEPVDAANPNLRIHHNHVVENGGLFEAGAGIGVYTGSSNYQVTRNYVCGNYAAGNGAGIAHWGLSPNGVIADNKVLFNQSFDQTVGTGGSGGGIYVAGVAPAAGGATPGSGSVRIERNVVLGNNAGSANGGGIALQFITGGGSNGTALVSVVNNMVTNNVSGLAGGGIALDNARRVEINNNTIVNNDSTATAALAFGGCAAAVPSVRSCPQTAGVWADVNSSVTAFRNNIVIGNRSFYWQVTNGIGALLPAGGTGTASFADLGGTVLYTGGTTTNPTGIRNSLLGSSNVLLGAGLPAYCGAGNGNAPRGNTCIDPTPTSGGGGFEAGAFAAPYWNSPPVFALDVNGVPIPGTSIPPEGTTLVNLQAAPVVAAATDEGGNFIDVHYGPLSLVLAETLGAGGAVTAETASNYHLTATTPSSIINATTCTGANPPAQCSGNSAAPANDIDGEPRARTAANAADRGADEYYATRQAAAPAAPVLEPIPNQSLLASRTGAANVYNYQALASDANGDQLRFRLLSGSGNGASLTLPANLSINADTGVISWSPVVSWPNNNFPATAGCTGTGNTQRGCTYTVQVTDASFAGNNSCPAASCAARSFTLTLRRNQGAPVAVNNAGTSGNPANQALQVNTTGIYTLAAPGVLANDTNPNNSNTQGQADFPLMARLVSDGTTANGKLTFGADGSVQFIPNADWVGTTSFTYQVSNDGVNWYGSAASPAGATVELRREIAVTTARYINGAWTFSGLGTTNGRRIQIVRDRAGPGQGNANIATGNTRPTVTAGHWPATGEFTRSGGPGFIDGDTVTITAQNANGGSSFQLLAVPVLSGGANDVHNTAYVQCPGDRNSDAVIDTPDPAHPRAVCRHLAAGDGFAVMGDGTELYTFGFNDVTGTPANQAIDKGILNAHFPAPTLEFKEGDEVYLTLTNVGMLKRPDLFDPHSVHFHGFPNAGSVFDGVPESSIAISMGFSFTYYYRTMDPGTYMYHCHVEAAEHMQMGMLGNLFVTPAQDGTAKTDASNGKSYRAFVYNDGDGSTGYDVMKAIQIGGFDSEFHKEHLGVQPLPFANMRDDYPMLNGRGYPDTVQYPDDNDPMTGVPVAAGGDKETSGVASAGESSQQHDSIVTATAGQRILLRISNLNVTQFFTLGTTGGLRMKVVGTGAHILRGPDGTKPLYYSTTSVTLGGGESADVLIDTTGVAPGTYLLYSTNLNELSNGAQDFGGMLTTIVIK